jgi:steroid 5-alpha reductase family enzyme
MIELWLATLACLAVLFVAGWAICLVLRDNTPIDGLWAVGLATAAVVAMVSGNGDPARRLLVLALVVVWAVRLAAHMWGRWLAEGHEDARYAAIRAGAGGSFWVSSLFTVFGLQAVVASIIAAPVLSAGAHVGTIGALAWIGAGLALAGLLMEASADLQLSRHRKTRPGVLLTTGLWAWTRHPNYVGEAAFWWGVWLIAADAGWTAAAWGLAGPALMTLLLTRATGVPMLEARLAGKPGWAEYAARTPAFLPRPPRR